jgi:hypothetical protein
MILAPRCVLLVLGLFLCSGSAAAQAPRGTRDSVMALVAEYDRAWNSKDTVTVKRLLAPEYQYFTSQGGVESRAGALTMLGSPDYALRRAQRSELEARVTEPVAVVSSRWQGEGTYRGERFVDDQRCGQVWLRASKTWQVLSEHCVQIVRTSPPSD